MTRNASIVLPISLNSDPLPSHLSIDTSSAWHTSALLATLVETATLPSRLKSIPGGGTSLGAMAETLTDGNSRKVARATMRIANEYQGWNCSSKTPGVVDAHKTSGYRSSSDLKLDLSFVSERRSERLGSVSVDTYVFGQLSTLRGFRPRLSETELPTDKHDASKFQR